MTVAPQGDSSLLLLETRRAEAIAFFQVNQAARNAVERVVALFFSVAAIAASVGVAAHTPYVVLPLPPLLLLLLSYMFQQYADLTVIGTARRRLEELVNDGCGGKGLLYETVVARIRKDPPLSRSVRFLQSMLLLMVIASMTAAFIVAIGDHDRRVLIGFVAATTLGLASFVYSWVHMLLSGPRTDHALSAQGLGNDRLVWISPELHRRVSEAALSSEPERQTVERLLERGLAD